MLTFTTTQAEIRNFARQIIGEPSTSQVYDDSFLDKIANQEQKRIFREFRWEFAQRNKLYNALKDVTLASAITAGDSIIRISASSGYPSSGYVFVNGEVLQYSALSSESGYDELTLVNTPTVNHSSGDRVKPMYEVPTNFGHRAKLFIEKTEYDFENYQDFYNQYQRYNRRAVLGTDDAYFGFLDFRYTIYNIGNKPLILISNDQNQASNIIELQYLYIPTDMSETVDCSLPDEFAEKVLGPLTAGRAMLYRRDPNGPSQMSIGEQELQNMAAAYYKEHFPADRKVKSKAIRKY